ncbi:integrase core domain-containing protein [Legionella sp. 27cVA30]
MTATALWRQDYNDFRPHSSLNNLTPNQFKQKVLSASFSR